MTPKHADEIIKQHKSVVESEGEFYSMFGGEMASLALLTTYPSKISSQLYRLDTHQVIAHHTTATGHRLELRDIEDGRVYEIIINPIGE